jgi:hypothetical protein
VRKCCRGYTFYGIALGKSTNNNVKKTFPLITSCKDEEFKSNDVSKSSKHLLSDKLAYEIPSTLSFFTLVTRTIRDQRLVTFVTLEFPGFERQTLMFVKSCTSDRCVGDASRDRMLKVAFEQRSAVSSYLPVTSVSRWAKSASFERSNAALTVNRRTSGRESSFSTQIQHCCTGRVNNPSESRDTRIIWNRR